MRKMNLKRVFALVCATAMCVVSLAGCGKQGAGKQEVDNTVEDKTTLKIMCHTSGYGEQWIQAVAKAFEEEYEGVTVEINVAKTTDTLRADMKNSKYCDTDIYIDDTYGSGHGVMESLKTAYNGGQAVRDITHLYNAQIPGTEITLGERINQSIKDACRYDGRGTEDTADDTYYYVPYVSSAVGLYYNETVINNALGEGNWELPRTSDELLELCKRLKEKECYFLLPGGLDQWAGSYYLAWWAQYEGMENFLKFFDGVGYDHTKGREATKSSLIFEQPGRLASIVASYDLLSYDAGITLKNSIEVNANNLNEYQTRFTLAKYKYAFYPCGDWLMQELENNSTIESDSVIKMMKTPVISSIIESTNSYSNDDTKRLPNIKDDKTLAAVVDYVDGKGKLPKGVTEEEAEIVREARNITGSMATNLIVYSPTFTNARTLADNFILFLSSDKGIQVFKDNCNGGFAPYSYEYEGLNVTEQSVYEVLKDAIFVDDFYYNELFYTAGVRPNISGSGNTLDGDLCQPNGLTGEEINAAMIDAFSGKKWDNYLSKLSN